MALSFGWVGSESQAANESRQSEALTSQNPSMQTPQLKAGQRIAIQAAKEEGVAVLLRSGWQTRLSIRGGNLSARRSFTGGRGLLGKGPGNYAENAVATLDNLSPLMAIRHAEKEFEARKVSEDHLGFHHVRITQLHQGLRVVGGDLVVHFDKTDVAYQVNGSYVPGIGLSTVPAINAEAAVQLAVSNLTASGHEVDQLVGAPELVVFARRCAPVLAYELLVVSLPEEGRALGEWKYWIDALTGNVVSRYNDVKDIAEPTANGSNVQISGRVLSREGGAMSYVTGWHETAGAYYLYNKVNRWFVYNSSGESGTYVDADTYAHRGAANWEATDRTEMSAALNFDATQAYYKNVHGRNSYDDAGAYAKANVHIGPIINAFWSSTSQQFYFGDGDDQQGYDPLVVLDVVAHEFTHAVTENEADLAYANESGALNESFSDVFGACVEFATQQDGRNAYPGSTLGKADWLVGEDCWDGVTSALRDMKDPRRESTAASPQPSRYHGSLWYYGSGDNGGVHHNSGVQNFFFYLLCDGGIGDNDGIAYNLAGIGIENAEKVAYRALTEYCTSSTDYHAVREAWLSAAADLQGAADWVSVVGATWVACGIDPPSTDDDGDGLPNAWELQYFSSTTGANPALDPDGDGHTNLEEFIAGMNPVNSTSVFHVVSQPMNGTNYVITWESIDGREYSIWSRGDLTLGGFTLLEPGITYPVNTYTDAVDQVQGLRFYKMDVKLTE